MPALKIDQFGGMLPAWSPRLLPSGQAAYAQNGYLFSGALVGWRKPKLLRALTANAARFVYRIPTSSIETANAPIAGVPITGDGPTVPTTPSIPVSDPTDVWMEFLDPDTNVFKSPVADDIWHRFYFASPSRAPEYNTYERIVAGGAPWLLGVPTPACAVTSDVTGGGNRLVLGNSTQNTTVVSGLGNEVYLTAITTPGDTQLSDVRFRTGAVLDDDLNANFAAVVYDDSAGAPGALISTGQIIKGVTASDVNESAFVNPPALLGDTKYWIGFIIDKAIPLQGGPITPDTSTRQFATTFTNGPPGTAPTAVSTAGLNMWGDFVTSDVLESRAYTYTWVTEYGEEGPPAPPTLLDGWSNGTWTLGLFQPPSEDLGTRRNLKKINIYRTVPGEGGQTVFFYVDTVDIGTATYVDTKANNVVALNDQLQSTTWFPPPAAMQGFQVLQNGMVAGFTNNEIWFCEPFHPHAWPPAYVLTTDYPIIGLGETSGALVVATTVKPYVVSGVTPSAMAMTKCSTVNPCASRASIVSGDAAVSYMSPNGLIQVSAAGAAVNTTDLWFTREQWQQLTPPHATRAVYLASCYYCLGSVSRDLADTSQAQRGFTIELDQDNTSFTIWPQPGGHRLGFELLTSPVEGKDVQNIQLDPWTGSALVIADGKVWVFDFADPAPALQTYTWRSKLYQQNARRNYSAIKVYFSTPGGTPTQNATRIEKAADDAVWASLPADCYGFIKTYVDKDNNGSMSLIDAREIRESGGLLRIVDGFKCDTWQWEIVARVPIANVQIATSVKELAHV